MQPQRHRFYEDMLALLTGTLLVSLGISLYSKAMLITGSSAGIALLLQYATGFGFGTVFFAVTIPFYYLAIKRMGWPFTIRTFIAVLLVSVFSRLTPLWIGYSMLQPLYAAVIGGALMGVGMLILFRHRTGLGGMNILALYLQDHYGIRAGYFQLAVDVVIMLLALFILDLQQVILSAIGAAVLNIIVGMNHRPGRYIGIS
ncbi:YitT family protein [Rhodopseudomonas sp. P2A-2r]|uniref:YitT family protein n=1 Tax=unclassified Rhodopseudomonas TaxID=2638247 RepID=UPI002234D49A|nr:YitT family protein [Rhodopseudomonas sp. P2A-2r]UZE47662.1 YitT family protein [Rhodopseudomonas sp. P2A-2r]